MGLGPPWADLPHNLHGAVLHRRAERLRDHHHVGLLIEHQITRAQEDAVIERVRIEDKVLEKPLADRILRALAPRVQGRAHPNPRTVPVAEFRVVEDQEERQEGGPDPGLDEEVACGD